MKKNKLPELVTELLQYDDCMSDDLRRVEEDYIKYGSLPRWTKEVKTDAWIGALDALNNLENVDAADTEMVRVYMYRHLAELYVRQVKRKAAKLARKRTQARKAQVGQTNKDNSVQLKESTIRRRAKVRGLKLEKQRHNPTNPKYRLYDPLKNRVVYGGNQTAYRATLVQCAKYINPEAVEAGQVFNPKHHKRMIKLVVKRFGHLEKLSVRENPADMRRHGTKHDRVRAATGIQR